MTGKILLTAIMLMGLNGLLDNTWAYEFEADNPRIKITIPGLPDIPMDVHPMRKAQPHLLYAGTNGKYTITILAPTADAGMTATECANSRINYYAAKYHLKDSQYALFKINESTTLFEYLSKTDTANLAHAHLFSSYKGTHCIDVHISRSCFSDRDFEELHKSFDGASIMPY